MATAGISWAQPSGVPGIERNGSFWVRTGAADELTVSDQVRGIELIAQGRVIVHGGPGNTVQMKVRQSVSTSFTALQALHQFGPSPVGFAPPVRANGVVRLVIQVPSTQNVSNELEIIVPRRLAVRVENRAGWATSGVRVFDIGGNVSTTANVGSLEFENVGGSITANTGGGWIHMGTIGGAVRCSTGGGEIRLDHSGGEVNCETAGGNIQIGYVGGSLEVSTEGGNIHVDQAAASVQAHSVQGVIEVVQARGLVTADTLGGSIEVGSSNGVKADSAAGGVRVRGASGPMTVSTMMGNVMAELLRGGRLENSAFATGSGDIVMTIPPDMGLSVRARNGSGLPARVISDFPEIQVKAMGWRSPAMGQGSINGGGPMIDLNAAGGAIYLKKSK
jgi:DUF4097 and DUF4098 domain-containing protein YvlB